MQNLDQPTNPAATPDKQPNAITPALFTIKADGSIAAICGKGNGDQIGLRIWPEGVDVAGPPDVEIMFSSLESMIRFFALEFQAATTIFEHLKGHVCPHDARRKDN